MLTSVTGLIIRTADIKESDRLVTIFSEETGVITAAVKGLSAIAVGCNIHDLHTPRERMELSSFARIYQTVLAYLRIV